MDAYLSPCQNRPFGKCRKLQMPSRHEPHRAGPDRQTVPACELHERRDIAPQNGPLTHSPLIRADILSRFRLKRNWCNRDFFTDYDSVASSLVSFTRSTANRKNPTASACRLIVSPWAQLSASSIRLFHWGYVALAHSAATFLEVGSP